MPESAAAAATQAYPAGNTALLADVRRFVAAASRPYLEQPSIHDLVLAVTEACATRSGTAAPTRSGSPSLPAAPAWRSPWRMTASTA